MLPPGRAKVSTKPWPRGSATIMNTIGIVLVCRRSKVIGRLPWARSTSGWRLTSSSRVALIKRGIATGPAPVDAQVAAFMPIEGAEPLHQSGGARLPIGSAYSDEHAEAPQLTRLLRAYPQRP